ncbi:MAG: hypothetical protein MSG64_12920 [Pyrinomonadaceae bacterium MAG19_C2-C3]|nr:hypothetical protein [Pyrinomonadaceae bacterium MAG19_C2-C3]
MTAQQRRISIGLVINNVRPLTTPEDHAVTAAPPTVQQRAVDNLAFIRHTMERAAAFTHVSGWGMVAVGALAFIASFAARVVAGDAALTDGRRARVWMTVWLVQAVISAAVAGVLIRRKARAADADLLSSPGKKTLSGFAPPMIAGALMTFALAQHGVFALLPGVWMLLYGVAVMTGGAHSVRTLPAMGVAFVMLGGIALFIAPAYADWLMGAGFGSLHVIFGILVVRRHGG